VYRLKKHTLGSFHQQNFKASHAHMNRHQVAHPDQLHSCVQRIPGSSDERASTVHLEDEPTKRRSGREKGVNGNKNEVTLITAIDKS